MTEARSDSPPFTGAGRSSRPAGIEYHLVRESVLRELRRGRLSREDLCDAQPELLRVARNLGRPASTGCPVCETANLVRVTFAFGSRLPACGRAVQPGELSRLSRRRGDVTCYLVEVCTECRWNHLLRSFGTGPPGPGGRAR